MTDFEILQLCPSPKGYRVVTIWRNWKGEVQFSENPVLVWALVHEDYASDNIILPVTIVKVEPEPHKIGALETILSPGDVIEGTVHDRLLRQLNRQEDQDPDVMEEAREISLSVSAAMEPGKAYTTMGLVDSLDAGAPAVLSVLRSAKRQGKVTQSWSDDGAECWTRDRGNDQFEETKEQNERVTA